MRAVHLLKALLFAALLTASNLPGGEALAQQKRVALVVGNSNYVNVRPLANPANDASAMAALFRDAKFDVVDASNNLGGLEMRRLFRDFAEKSRGADIAVVYYAGHGIEIDGINYLLPVDTALKRDLDVEDEAISLDRVVRVLEPAKRLRLIILDACRDNPFVKTVRRTSETRSIGRGLVRIEPPSSDTLIAYAAKERTTASDGDGEHSPFTTALLKYLTAPGLDLRIALGRVRDDVMEMTHNRQEPFVYGSLGGSTVSLVPEPVKAVATPAPDPNADARRDYEFASQVGTREAWDSFLALHATGFYADLARGQRTKLNVDTPQVATRTTPPAASSAPPPSSAAATPPPIAPEPKPPVNAMTSVTPPPEPAKPKTDPSETAKLMHAELQRLGCYPGALDASWGPDSRSAMARFNKNAGANLDTKVATLDTLDVLRAKPTRVCPLECKSGYRSENEACVKIVCRSGFVADENGDCERERPRKSRTASRPDREDKPAARRRPSGETAPAQIVCGMNGCLNVKKGCKSQMVASGNGQVAVVTCD